MILNIFPIRFFFAKLLDIICCFLLSIFIVIVSDFLKIFNLDDLLSSENNIRGGDKDKEEKEFMVFPYKIELYFVATTVIPVANAESVFLKLSLFTFFINFFVKK